MKLVLNNMCIKNFKSLQQLFQKVRMFQKKSVGIMKLAKDRGKKNPLKTEEIKAIFFFFFFCLVK